MLSPLVSPRFIFVTLSTLCLLLGGCTSSDEEPPPDPPDVPDPFAGLEFAPPPWERTETRETCDDYDGLRRPLFGEQHIHTSFSFDAYGRGTRGDPRAAYDFAQGDEITLPDENGGQERSGSIDRPLDWLMVADHALFFGEVRECITETSGAYDEPLCAATRDPFGNSRIMWPFAVADPSTDPPTVVRPSLCGLPGVDCEGSITSVWQETQDAAEEAYDRTAGCGFTSFIGYEHTGDLTAPVVVFDFTSSIHRNMMFRNDVVPDRPESAIDSVLLIQDQVALTGDALQLVRELDSRLWDWMDEACNDADTGCEVLAITHNSNLAAGLVWSDPQSRQEAERRQKNEPVVEIIQQKGASECRYDRIEGAGVRTADELCTFEQQTERATNRRGADLPTEEYFPRNHVRNALKDGLAFEDSLGVNPFMFGIVGSTDNHNSASGNTTEDENWTGMRGSSDATAEARISTDQVVERNPGGLAVAWAEENSRDSIFEAFARREVYGTSGHRPYLRFFAGNLDEGLCDSPELVESAYRMGVPMGAVIGAARGTQSPRFLVHAMKDPGGGNLPGTDLQRVQVIKGWVDGNGETQEQVFEVAGDPNNGADVNPDDCEPTGTGFADLCTVWEDPNFDPNQRAFYYARAVDNPTCRWSTLTCQSLGVNPFSPTCEQDAADSGMDLANCCISEEDERFFSRVIQERAWSSPIWYEPDAMGSVSGQLLRTESGDSLSIEVRLRTLPASFDPASDDLALRITDNDEIYAVVVPGGSLSEAGAGQYTYADNAGDLNGLTEVSLATDSEAATILFAGSGMNLSSANLNDHFVSVEVSFGQHTTRLSTLWTGDGTGTLQP